MNRMDPSLDPGENILRPPEILPLPQESKIIKEENDPAKELDVFPSELVTPKDEEEEEQIEALKNEDEEVYKEARYIKDEPIDDLLSDGDDSIVEMEEDEHEISESSEEEDLLTTSARSTKKVNCPLDSEKIQIIRDRINDVTNRSQYKGERKEQLKAALYAICVEGMNGRTASKKFDVGLTTIYPRILQIRKGLAFVQGKKKEFEPGEPLDPLDTERIQTIRDYINATVNYRSTGEREHQLKAALFTVCIGELSLTAASKKFEVPISTLGEKISIVRKGLGSILPPQSKGYTRPTKTNGDDYPTHIDARYILDPLDPENQNIRDAIRSVVKPKSNIELNEAVFAVCTDELTLTESSKKYHVHKSTLLVSVQKTLKKLGRPYLQTTKKKRQIDDGKKSGDEETVTIDGITVPNSFGLLNAQLAISRLNYSKAQPFQGAKEELREKLITILQTFNIQLVSSNIVDAIMHVYVEGHTISEACQIYKVTDQIFSNCFKVVKVFVDFSKSPCTRGYQDDSARCAPMQFRKYVPMGYGGMEPPKPLPIPQERIMNDLKIKKEDIKEEPIEPHLMC